MKKLTLLGLSLLLTTIVFAQKSTDNFVGKYKTDDGGTIVITKTANGFIGTDVVNKVVVLKDVKFTDGEWKATIYNPKQDVTAKAEILLEGSKLKIVAHKGFLSKTLYWDVQK